MKNKFKLNYGNFWSNMLMLTWIIVGIQKLNMIYGAKFWYTLATKCGISHTILAWHMTLVYVEWYMFLA